MRCDFDGGEPLDVTRANICVADIIPAVRAQAALVRTRRPTEVVAEWVEFPGLPDRPAGAVARRVLKLQNNTSLPVGLRDDRFVTFLRPGSSPATVDAYTLTLDGGWVLPEVARGGELVVRVSRAPIVGVRYHLVGSAGRDTMPVRNVASFRAVPAGAYELVPEYEGGLLGQATPAHVQDGKTTFIALPEEQVGGLQVAADPVVCRASSSLTISSLRASSRGGSSSIQTVLTLPTREECVFTIAGLRPGNYQVSLRGAKGQLAAETCHVAAQALTSLAVRAESAQVDGQVTLNGLPLQNAVVRFVDPGNPTAQHQTRTDDDGVFDLTLPAPGRFQVWFLRDGTAMLGNEREVTLEVGANHTEFHLEGVALNVTLRRWPRQAAVDVSVRPLEMSGPGMGGEPLRIRPTDDLPVVFSGLRPGKYAVQAREEPVPGQEWGRVAGATVTLEYSSAETEIELELTHGGGAIRVVDQAGVPIANARVKAGEEQLMETAPSVFSLGGIAPATPVVVSAPGFVPVIRLVPRESPFDIVLLRGSQVHLQFVAGNPPVIRGSLVWPGTDVMVPLHLFAVTRLPGEAGGFVVHNFPAVPGVVYVAGPFDPPESYQPVSPNASGVVWIR